eukprot:3499991-Amphidinium_carterae.1
MNDTVKSLAIQHFYLLSLLLCATIVGVATSDSDLFSGRRKHTPANHFHPVSTVQQLAHDIDMGSSDIACDEHQVTQCRSGSTR